jgi:endonuclease G
MNRIATFLLFAVLFVPITCKKAEQPGPDTSIPTRDANLALGNPSGANSSQENNYLIERTTYSLSYNHSAGIAN